MFSVKRRTKIIFLILFFALLLLIFLIVELGNNEKNVVSSNYKRDWHDYDMMAASLNRRGPGEKGMAVFLADYRKALYNKYGFEAVISDLISVNRSVPDVRPTDCKTKSYLAKLPKTAIIIIFYNERLSVLLRTIYSILNRSPPELIEEIILVDDGSNWPELHEPLAAYMNQNFRLMHSKVRLIRLRKRSGIMVARMIGARNLTKESEVVIFLDSHFEMMYNWLPPLLEPIALNPRACTVPDFDTIKFGNFEYEKDEPFRGYFDWFLGYRIVPLYAEELAEPARNFREYVMMGGALAIGVDFFWELGGFDEGMLQWGGEQHELSFKIWMCGGELIKVPCSRMGHLFRDPKTKGNTNLYKEYSFLDKNFRRLIDVWLDEEHRQYVLNHLTHLAVVDPGDLTERYALRERLQCKSFSWMLEHIMPDLKEIFPPIEQADYANGTIRSVLYADKCIGLDSHDKEKIILINCNSNDWHQIWHNNWRCQLRMQDDICMEADDMEMRVNSFYCDLFGSHQQWFYDVKRQWIVHIEYNMCMAANNERNQIDLKICDQHNLSMKWTLKYYNETALRACGKNGIRSLYIPKKST